MIIKKGNKKISKIYIYKDKIISKYEDAFGISEMIDYGFHVICTVKEKKY